MRIARVFRLAVADALANRRSFYVQVIAMAINDLTWVIFWLLFFHAVGNVRGWHSDDPLAFLLARRVDTALLGDLAMGPLLFAYASDHTPESLAIYLGGVACASVV